MSMLDFALSLAGLPQEQIEALGKEMPALGRLAAMMKKLEPVLVKAQPLLTELQPLVIEAWGIVRPELVDIKAVLPTAEEFIAFITAKENST